MGIRIVTGPTLEPITLAELKAQVRVDHTDEDALLGLAIAAARAKAENETRAAIMTRRVEQTLDRFPCASEADIDIQLPPAWNTTVPLAAPITLVSVAYVDTAGVTQTIPSTDYTLDDRFTNGSFWVLPAYGLDWPETRDIANAVRIQYDTGYAAQAAIPADLRAWVLMTAAFVYENREAMIVDGRVVEIPNRFTDSLLDPYRVYRL